MSATKHDQGKVRYEFIDPMFLEDVAKVLTFGAQKYGDWNFKKGLESGRVYSALMRHIEAWRKGEKVDAETGITHLAHAAVNLMFLHYFDRTTLKDKK